MARELGLEGNSEAATRGLDIGGLEVSVRKNLGAAARVTGDPGIQWAGARAERQVGRVQKGRGCLFSSRERHIQETLA